LWGRWNGYWWQRGDGHSGGQNWERRVAWDLEEVRDEEDHRQESGRGKRVGEEGYQDLKRRQDCWEKKEHYWKRRWKEK